MDLLGACFAVFVYVVGLLVETAIERKLWVELKGLPGDAEAVVVGRVLRLVKRYRGLKLLRGDIAPGTNSI